MFKKCSRYRGMGHVGMYLFLVLAGGPPVILIRCTMFLLRLQHIVRMSMSTFSFFAKLNSGTLYLQNAFLWLAIWMTLILELIDTFYLWVLSNFPILFYIFLLLFLVTSCIRPTVQLCVEWILIWKNPKFQNCKFKVSF